MCNILHRIKVQKSIGLTYFDLRGFEFISSILYTFHQFCFLNEHG